MCWAIAWLMKIIDVRLALSVARAGAGAWGPRGRSLSLARSRASRALVRGRAAAPGRAGSRGMTRSQISNNNPKKKKSGKKINPMAYTHAHITVRPYCLQVLFSKHSKSMP